MRGQPAPVMRARNFSGYRSPFQQPMHTGISSLVDFREGVQIVDDQAYPALQPPTRAISSAPPAILEAEDVEVTDHDLRQMIDRNLNSNKARKATPKQPVNEMRSTALQGHADPKDTDKKIEQLLADLDRLKRENDARLHELHPKPIAARPKDNKIEDILADLERMRKDNESRSAQRVSAPFQSRVSRLSTQAYQTMVRA